ncbi:MAG TPA: hypothetical protein EYQ24_15490 [Bacteroidetes bacterium]|nr:hypothetical protein [Bacteroidota bacterium]HIL57372.1 hypothetical protein [Rhodothermales bacterium]
MASDDRPVFTEVPLSSGDGAAPDPPAPLAERPGEASREAPDAASANRDRQPTAADLRLLRRLLLGRDRDDALDRVSRGDLPAAPARLDARSVGRVLPDAVRFRESEDEDLGEALAGPVERGLKASVERNPQPVVDAIFPVIGPAIRRAIRHAMAQSLESVNQSVNYGLSWRGLKWRAEAWRSGLSFGEVVLRHTLQYRAEEVLLVHRETGLLLQHVVAPDVPGAGEDADLVGAMLTAVRQFVGDSFSVDEDDGLEAVEVGDLTVWIEPGPRAIIAAVLRGHPPESYRETLRRAVETIHARMGEALTTFTGETAPFDASRDVLEGCLDAAYAEEPRSGLSPQLAVLLLVLLGAMAWLGVRWWDGHARETAYLQALDAAPGLEVLRTDREGGRLLVVGARDPLADDPDAFLAAAGLDRSDVDARWVTAFSADSALVAQRATQAFRPPDGVRLAVLPDGTIRALGPASADTAWASAARDLLPLVPGADRLDLSGLRDDLGAAIAEVEALALPFGDNGSAPPPDALAPFLARAERLAEAARQHGESLTLEITGHTDDRGTPDANRALGLARAQAVARAVTGALGDRLPVRTLSRGADETLGEGAHPPSRRATFRVLRAE